MFDLVPSCSCAAGPAVWLKGFRLSKRSRMGCERMKKKVNPPTNAATPRNMLARLSFSPNDFRSPVLAKAPHAMSKLRRLIPRNPLREADRRMSGARAAMPSA